ncbi:membrane protein [Buchnera aphidicola (Schlechtendalia chinensis)]|uniref:Probable lipid II flippase MurJ n=1 Tax=Buchnera aphidicola subsp. Schlechtendalia chinensis TaxID=118110 RepID=A0A172WDM7_BUCSC|nr:murein biosynthesis integral membrane protein MurJ [Buchnera aphidicola]ANF17083.1 membrane protein [Buchnera aphidicola (Schlechtendalia chinensis)]
MNVLKKLISLSSITFFSRILGFVRDSLIAYMFGVSETTDSFFLAFKIPNLLRRIFSEGFFSQVLIPILSKYKKNCNIKVIQNFFSNILGFMIVILSVVTIFGIFFSYDIISVLAPGLNNSSYKFRLTTELLKIIFPYVLFISLGSLIGSVLNTWNYFFIPACSPVLFNLNVIIFILYFSSYFKVSVFSLAWAVLLGGFIQFIYQIPFLKKIDMLVFPKFCIKILEIQKIFNKIIVVIIGISTNQISIIINTIFSSFLVTGSISWMYYSDRLIEFISGIFGVSLGTILLPLLSNSVVNANRKEYYKLLDWSLRIGCLIAIPSSIALAILSKTIVIVLFQYGNFSIYDVIMTKNILILHSIGLIPLILIKIMLPGFYSNNEFKTPILISIFILIVTQMMNLFFLSYLNQNSFALSASIASWIHCILLFRKLLKKKLFCFEPGWLIFLGKIFVSVLVMVSILTVNLHIFYNLSSEIIIVKFFQLFLICFLSGCSYLITLFALGLRLYHFSFFMYKKY